MNLNLRRIRRTIVAGSILALSTLLGFNCAKFNSSTPASISSETPQGTQKVDSPVALLSSEQILKTMISVTGTEGLGELSSAADDLIKRTYDERSGALPSGQSLKLAGGPTLISVANLASAVCAKAVDRDRGFGEDQRAERLFFREMDFSKGLGEQSDDSITLAFERLARNAWRRDATDEEVEVILDFAREYAAEADPSDTEQTRLLAVSTCTAVLASVDALTY